MSPSQKVNSCTCARSLNLGESHFVILPACKRIEPICLGFGPVPEANQATVTVEAIKIPGFVQLPTQGIVEYGEGPRGAPPHFCTQLLRKHYARENDKRRVESNSYRNGQPTTRYESCLAHVFWVKINPCLS